MYIICLYVPYSILSKYLDKIAALTILKAKELKLPIPTQSACMVLFAGILFSVSNISSFEMKHYNIFSKKIPKPKFHK